MAFRDVATHKIDATVGDALLYREYTLGLIWPRSCPDYLDDDVVSEWLNHCARTECLPWMAKPGV